MGEYDVHSPYRTTMAEAGRRHEHTTANTRAVTNYTQRTGQIVRSTAGGSNQTDRVCEQASEKRKELRVAGTLILLFLSTLHFHFGEFLSLYDGI